MAAYYNENDAFCVQWLRNLIQAGLIAPGEVDDRSIEDVRAADLAGYTQCHFFAGIGVWSYALRLAGWPDERSVWTGSCPCQPFSTAGDKQGFADQRHLWPVWLRLIEQCRPPVVFGEQVANGAGLDWFDVVHHGLAAEGYAVGCADLCAASVGAPHIRQRLYFVADRGDTGILAESAVARRPWRNGTGQRTHGGEWPTVERDGATSVLADDDDAGRGEFGATRLHADRQPGHDADRRGTAGVVDLAAGSGRGGVGAEPEHREPVPAGANFWSAADWLPCRDGRARPVEPGTFPVVDGATARLGRLRAYGNAVVAPVAEAFIRAYLLARS